MKTVITILALFYVNTAFGNSMSYRKDAAVVPGYNTGTGRFVDEDRKFAIEADAYMPIKATQSSEGKNKVEEWSAEFQYNIMPVVAGAEFAFGNYVKRGKASDGATLSDDESYKILYNRYQVTVSMFSKKEQMKSWYGKVGYSYTKIDAETNLVQADQPRFANIDEVRNGATIAAGYRFSFFKNRVSVNTGVAHTKTMNRKTSSEQTVDSRYESILANAGAKRLASKDFPELRIAFGVLF